MNTFIITIDTEGDNLWDWKIGDSITTENSLYLQRFQGLCNQYGFKPVWLTNWEMMHDTRFVDFSLKEYIKGNCEIGMHLHAWNTPPYYKLPHSVKSGAPYLIEYPDSVMEEKIGVITDAFVRIFGFQPLSHRAGRWAVNDEYLSMLAKYGYKIDCSITPGINWKKSFGQTPGFYGPDYTKETGNIEIRKGILEVPLTTITTNKYYGRISEEVGLYNRIKSMVKKGIRKNRTIMLRPNGRNLQDMLEIVRSVKESDAEYLMFMIHSSELMPGGSPTFTNTEAIEHMYEDINLVFSEISASFLGDTLDNFHNYVRV